MALTKVRGAGAEGLTLSSTALTVANGLTLTDGNIVVASGHGINYDAAASGGAAVNELLDHYEEGLFTPTLTAGSGSFTLESGSANGVYTKIGNLVNLQINLYTSAISSPSGNLNVGGFPFTSAQNNVDGGSSNYNGRTAGCLYVDLQASGESGNFMALLIANSTYAVIYNGEDNSNTGSANLIDASTYISLGITYRTQ